MHTMYGSLPCPLTVAMRPMQGAPLCPPPHRGYAPYVGVPVYEGDCHGEGGVQGGAGGGHAAQDVIHEGGHVGPLGLLTARGEAVAGPTLQVRSEGGGGACQPPRTYECGVSVTKMWDTCDESVE